MGKPIKKKVISLPEVVVRDTQNQGVHNFFSQLTQLPEGYNGSVYNALMSQWSAHGKPDITLASKDAMRQQYNRPDSYGRPNYSPFSNEIQLPAGAPRSQQFDNYMGELAHSEQFKKSSFGEKVGSFVSDWVTSPYFSAKGREKLYNTVGTSESTAHGEIEPILKNQFYQSLGFHPTDINAYNGQFENVVGAGPLPNKNITAYQYDNGGKITNMAAAHYTVIEVPKADSGMGVDPKPMEVLGGGYMKQLSYNPFDGGTALSVGRSHEAGGMPVDTNGDGKPEVEIEGGESVHTSPLTGEKYVGGNLYIPGTKTKFKAAFQHIAKEENKAHKQTDKGQELMENNNPESKFEKLTYNSGQVMSWSAMRRQKAMAEEKEKLAQTQQAIHDVAAHLGVKPKELDKKMKFGGKVEVEVVGIPTFRDGGKLPSAKDGYKTQNDDIFNALSKHPDRLKYVDWAKEAADAAGIDPGTFHRLLYRESGFNPNAKSGVGAKGIAQFMPATYKEVGGNPSDFNSSSEESIRRQLNAAALHFKGLQDQNGGDTALAAIAYNGGQGAVNYVKKQTGNPKITGQDWVSFMDQRRQEHPTNKTSAWQNQTYDYVKALSPDYVSNADFYADKMPAGLKTNQTFQKEFYSRPGVAEMTPLSPTSSIYNPPAPGPLNPLITSVNYDPQALGQYQESPDPAMPKRKPSLADSNKFRISSILPELAVMGDRPDFVPGQELNPALYNPYQVSFQDRLNENNASFRAMSQQVPGNPEAMAVLAAQKYGVDNGVIADQFRTNQQIQNDVTNKNIGIINDTRAKNLALADQQFTRQTQAKENTRANFRTAANSITSKIAANRLENNNIRMEESMYNYRYNPVSGQMEYVGPKAVFNTNGASVTPYDPNTQYTVKEKINSNGTSSKETTSKRNDPNQRGKQNWWQRKFF